MAAVTAAVIGAVAAVGSAGYGAYSASQAGGGGGPGNPQFKQLPADALDNAMRTYYARATVANADKTYPAFGDYVSSGGDPSKRKFDLTLPDMKPSEASAFGFIGGQGETIPTLDQAAVRSGDIKNMTPEQILYMAKERRRQAFATGQTPGVWVQNVLGTNKRLADVRGHLTSLQEATNPTPWQERRINRLQNREERLASRQYGQLNPDTQTHIG